MLLSFLHKGTYLRMSTRVISSSKRVAVTGATGYLGEYLIDSLIQQGCTVNAIARNEGKLVALKERFGQVSIFPCPIEDFCLLRKAVRGCCGVYHLAAFKDVILSDFNPVKAVQTNVLGTLNLLRLSMELKEIKFLLATSSDKAVQVSGVYGATKLILERMFSEFHQVNGEACDYRIVRYGNVFYSTGSVLVKWKKALSRGQHIVITEPTATRFFLTRRDALSLIFKCLKTCKDAEPLLPSKMKSVEIGTLLEVMIEKYGSTEPKIKIIGLQKGENKHELIHDGMSSMDAPRWSKRELLEVL